MAYFPNSTAGEVLDRQCCDCPLGAGWNDPSQGELFAVEREMKPCPVYFVQMDANYDQVRQQSCGAVAKYLQRTTKGKKLPPELEAMPDGQKTFKPAIDWLRNDGWRDSLNLLIDENGICQVREQLRQIRKDQGR